MKKIVSLLCFSIVLFCTILSLSSTNLYAEEEAKRYVVFVGKGELGEPILTYQKVGDQVSNPSIFNPAVLQDKEIPLVVVVAKGPAGQIPPGVERVLREHRLNTGEEATVIMIDKDFSEKISRELKTELSRLGLTLDNNGRIIPNDLVSKHKLTLKDRLKTKLSDYPTMATLFMKQLIQVFSCYWALVVVGKIENATAMQIISFVSVNLLVTTGINLFIEEFIKVRSTFAHVFNVSQDKIFDTFSKMFINLTQKIGDIRDKKNHHNLLKATMGFIYSGGDLLSKSFSGWMKKTSKFLIRGDMFFQTFLVSLPMLYVSWVIFGVSPEAFNALKSVGITDTGLDAVVLSAVILATSGSLSGTPLDLINSYFNKIGVFKNKVNIWISLLMEVLWQKDKLGQVKKVDLNYFVNAVFAVVSLPAYLVTHYLIPVTRQDNIIQNSEAELNKITEDIIKVLETNPNLAEDLASIARFENMERSGLGIGFLDKLLAKPDTQLVIDLARLLQKYKEDGTFERMPKVKGVNYFAIENLLGSLDYIRKQHEVVSQSFDSEERVVINQAIRAVREARNFNEVKTNFWRQSGVTLKNTLHKVLGFFGWRNTNSLNVIDPITAQQNIDREKYITDYVNTKINDSKNFDLSRAEKLSLLSQAYRAAENNGLTHLVDKVQREIESIDLRIKTNFLEKIDAIVNENSEAFNLFKKSLIQDYNGRIPNEYIKTLFVLNKTTYFDNANYEPGSEMDLLVRGTEYLDYKDGLIYNINEILAKEESKDMEFFNDLNVIFMDLKTMYLVNYSSVYNNNTFVGMFSGSFAPLGKELIRYPLPESNFSNINRFTEKYSLANFHNGLINFRSLKTLFKK